MLKNQINYFKSNDWKIKGLEKTAKKIFIFEDFKSAFTWMTCIAIEAEKTDHHPEWKNVYNKISVVLSTHDKGKLTSKDFFLAKFMDIEFERYR